MDTITLRQARLWPRICPALEEKARAWAEFEGLEPVFAGE